MERMKAAVLLATLIICATSNTVRAEEAQIEVPQEVIQISEELGEQYCICPELIQAICWKESRFQADVEGNGCVGIMQISPRRHKDRMERLGVTDLTDIEQNMTVGVDYLAELSEGSEDIVKVLAEYHGESDIEERLEQGEVSDYVSSILSLSEELERSVISE